MRGGDLPKAFSYGEGGPLAVDEVIGIISYLFLPHPPRSSAPSPQEKANVNRAFGQQTNVRR